MRPELSVARFCRWLAFGLICLALFPALAVANTGPGRALELVTPGDPVAGRVFDLSLVGPDGTRMVYVSLGPMPGAIGGNLLASNEAVRGASGWTTKPIGFPYLITDLSFEAILTAFPQAFSPDLSASVWLGLVPLLPGSPVGQPALYRLDSAAGLTLLAKVDAPEAFVGASDDTQHVVFTSAEHLLPADSARTSGKSIYEVDGTTLRLVDVDSGGAPLSACGSIASSREGVSVSGSRVFLVSPPPFGSCAGESKVYLREGGTTTVPVSASQCSRIDCNSSRPVSFAGATPDGSTVFMTTTQQLVDADVDEKRDLYAFDVLSGTLSRLSEAAPGEGGQTIEGPVKAAGDGSAVYFYAEGRLLSGLGQEGGSNLYLADGDGIHFVAPIETGSPLQVSKSAGVAVFSTTASLEAADNDGARDVYVYDAADGSVTRVSAGAGGGNGSFGADIASPIEPLGFGLVPVERALSEDGTQVFFSTAEGLLPEDGNGVLDVYGWSAGQLELISSGAGNAAAEFASASADGSTVVFKTSQTLLPVDRDGGERDLYAARVGGGFPFETEPDECAGEGCLGPVPGRVVRNALASEAAQRKRARRAPRVGRIGSRVAREIVERGYADVAVRVFGPGAVVARASDQSGERDAVALRGVAGAVRAGTVALRLHAAGWARQELRREHALRLRLTLRQSGSRVSTGLVFRWEGTR